MSQQPQIEETGSLGVVRLKRLWWRWTHRGVLAERGDAAARQHEWAHEMVLIHGLGIGLEQIARYLTPERTFDELEAWILELNGGSIDSACVARLNAALTGGAYDTQTQRRFDEIAAMPAVFDASDLETWDERGIVVLRDAISAQQCAAAVDAVHEFIGVRADDASTWYQRNHAQGIMVQLFQHPALEPARRSARIHKAFSQLWGTTDLLPTFDRCGFNPPEQAGFIFPGPHLHWDADMTKPVGFGVQGLLYLGDTAAEQGAFSCVPGFHKTLDGWLQSLPPRADPHDHIRGTPAKAIAGKAGDLILWHQALPHGSSPNRAARPRVVQYLTMFPARPSERF